MDEFDRSQEINIKAFGQHLSALLEEASGQFVVIKDGAVAGTFRTVDSALQFGFTRFGRAPFLVQQVVPLRDQVSDFHFACPA